HAPLLAEAFRAVIAIDADPRRLLIAERTATETTSLRRWFALSLMDPVFAESPELAERFALIHCVQVLGHVPIAAIDPILGAFFRILAPGAALILAVPYTNAAVDQFRIAEVTAAGGHLRDRQISAEAYDRMTRAPEDGRLPVRHFALPTISRAIKVAGFVV